MIDKRLQKEGRLRQKFWVVEDRRPYHKYELQVTLARQQDEPSITKETNIKQ